MVPEIIILNVFFLYSNGYCYISLEPLPEWREQGRGNNQGEKTRQWFFHEGTNCQEATDLWNMPPSWSYQKDMSTELLRQQNLIWATFSWDESTSGRNLCKTTGLDAGPTLRAFEGLDLQPLLRILANDQTHVVYKKQNTTCGFQKLDGRYELLSLILPSNPCKSVQLSLFVTKQFLTGPLELQ